MRTLAVLLTVLIAGFSAWAAEIEPVLTETEAVAGLPLVMPVRLVGSGPPPPRVVLRFPDGREVVGDVAAVRLVPPQPSPGWLEEGPGWEVLSIGRGMRTPDEVAWFVLADLPRGVVGQEIWIGGRPVRIRWLSRPAVLAMRLGFDLRGGGPNPLLDPWMSPVPESWRARADLRNELEPARLDPLRSWRVTLATDGLYPAAEGGGVGVTPDLLDSGVVEAETQQTPIADRLLAAVSAHAAARWRMALARLWAADASLSLRVRHALAGAGRFSVGSADSDRIIAPAWTADDREAEALLTIMLGGNAPLTERAAAAREWLEALPGSSLWVLDDGHATPGVPITPTIGALRFAASDGAAILMHGGPEIARPEILTTRSMRTLRPMTPPDGVGGITYRIDGTNRRVPIAGQTLPLEPPGLATGPMAPDWTMTRLVRALDPRPRARGNGSVDAPSVVLTAEGGGPGLPPRCSLLLTIPDPGSDAWECRIWIGPYGRSHAVLVADSEGGSSIQPMRGGRALDLPRIDRGLTDGGLRLEIGLPAEAAEADGVVHLGIEFVRGGVARTTWPRPMLPWQIEPGRRIVDPSAWFGELGR